MIEIIDGNTAAAYGALLSNVKYVPCFPITPQTSIIESIAKWKADGVYKGDFKQFESEHSVMSAAIGSEATGCRTFTASSSQGILLMHEMLPIASGMRLPLVMVNVSRGLSAPITLWCFTAEAEVLMADLTYKKIKDVKEGDFVIGVDRKIGGGDIVATKVKKTFFRETKDLIRLKTEKFELTCTTDHEFYYHPTNRRWIKAKSLKGKNLKWFGYGFEENEEYKRGWLAGVADGDGCFSYTWGGRYFRYEIHANDKEMIDKTVEYCLEFGFKIRGHDYRKKYGQYGAIISSDKEARRFKRFVKKTMNPDFCRGYLGGMYDAEGTGPYGKTRALIIYNSDTGVIDYIIKCLNKVGLKYKKYYGKRSYQININNAPKFFIMCKPKIKRKLNNITNTTMKALKDTLKIEKTEKLSKTVAVYNLETETNNYIVNGLLVHNCDHNDVLAMRDSGFMIFMCETNQEVLDSVIIAYKVCENENVLLPAIVNMDGFIHSNTRTQVNIPSQSKVDRFLPKLNMEIKLDTAKPMSLGVPVMAEYMYFRQQLHKAQLNALDVIDKAHKEFYNSFGRRYDHVEKYKLSDADIAFVMMGANSSIAKEAVDRLRKKGFKVGLLRIRVYRPFPEKEIREALMHVSKIAVLDQNICPGMSGILYQEVKSSLHNTKSVVSNFIISLGGRPISRYHFKQIALLALKHKHEVREWVM